MKLGIDFGNTIVGSARGHVSEENTGSSSIEKPLAIETITRLITIFGADNTFIISKARPSTQTKILAWLDEHQFYIRTGFKKDNIYFCLERCEKGQICDKLKIDIMVDDRPEVMAHLKFTRFRLLFDPLLGELTTWLEQIICAPAPIIVRNWSEIGALIDWMTTIPREQDRDRRQQRIISENDELRYLQERAEVDAEEDSNVNADKSV